MTNDGQTQEVHATVTSSGHSREPADGDQAQRPDVLDGEVVDDEETIDPDAVIIEEGPAGPAGEEAPPGPADDVSSGAADDEPGRDPVTSTGTPAGSDVPADTNMATRSSCTTNGLPFSPRLSMTLADRSSPRPSS
jgi:hypothetical protein